MEALRSTRGGEVHVIVGPMFAGKTTALLRRVQSESDNGRSGFWRDELAFRGKKIRSLCWIDVGEGVLVTEILDFCRFKIDSSSSCVLCRSSVNTGVFGPKRNVAIIKSDKDSRYGLDSIVTHDGAKLPCWALPDLSSFRQKIGKDAYNKFSKISIVPGLSKQIDVIGIDEAQFFEDLYDFCCNAADYDGKTVIVAGLDGDYLRRRFGSVLDIIPLADSVTKLTARCEICGKRALFTLRKTTETKTELIGGADVYMPVCRQHYVNGQVAVEAARTVLESKKVERNICIEAAP
ncbi:hypothetical protein Scep_028929 [Stephania cephalantha]|uniref:Thymidine kinase n=1 Tax=Stephania cephalantha TaxID=152367 RepID=A0AAP0HM98_9MAGN